MLVIFLLLVNVACYAQAAICMSKMNVAYVGLPNPLTIAVERIRGKDVVLASGSEALIEGNDCHYIFSPRKTRDMSINIFVKKKVH